MDRLATHLWATIMQRKVPSWAELQGDIGPILTVMSPRRIPLSGVRRHHSVSANMCANAWLRNRISLPVIILALTIATATVARADTFGSVHYDAKSNQILVTVHYWGTSSNHHFSVQWGRCRKLHGNLHGPAPRAIDLGILDAQGNDAAKRRYTQLVIVSLAGMSCRPATVNLWTSPNQYRSISIP